MSKKITQIPYWGILLDCYGEKAMPIVESQDPNQITEKQWLAIARWWRNALLNESDWSQVPDNSLTENQRESWRQYRQELRDITDKYPNPKNIVFPDLPS
jgi:hypothetical protein